MFINYNGDSDLSINNFHKPGYSNSDVTGLVDDIIAGRYCFCPLEGTRAMLEDSAVWQGSNAKQEVLDRLHAVICEHEQYGQGEEEA